MFSLFNAALDQSSLFLLSLFSFGAIFTFRQLFIHRAFFVGTYYVVLAGILFIAALGGGGVQNDGYKRLNQFVELENNGQLANAQNNPEQFDGMFQIDLQEFKDSAAFRDYLHKHDTSVDRAEAISLGWLYAVIAELSLLVACIVSWLLSRTKKLF